MYVKNLATLRSTRAATLQLCSGLTQAQSEFAAKSGTWSVGENLHHLIRTESFYRQTLAQLIERQKAGKRAVLQIGLKEVNTSIAYIPKSVLPLLEIPFTVFNMFVPNMVREAAFEYRLIPAQRPDVSKPAKGMSIESLRKDLKSSFEELSTLFYTNPSLDYRAMKVRHPIIGSHDALQILRVIALHEKRHQSQIRDILRSPNFPAERAHAEVNL